MPSTKELTMEPIFGKVTALDPSTKTLAISAPATEPSGEVRTQDIEVPFSEDTAFKSKRKRAWGSKPERVKPGMDVIVQREGPGAPADEVWHTPVIGPITVGPIKLTIAECKNLGGTVEEDRQCPNIGGSAEGTEVHSGGRGGGNPSFFIQIK
jgi:hypothetical protein